MSALLSLLPSLVPLVQKWLPDRAAQDSAIAELNMVVNAAASKVGDAMVEDSKSTNWFQAGWRPSIGWTCSLGLFVHYLVFPITALFVPGLVSPLDIGSLMPIVMALLGLGGLRTVERIKGKA